ncbi:hypothetical protein [Arenimonas sp.]|uniref:hypothetical protein n=1 Tax=Arenimonas sp. TaxID=1872635 RepID=UPI0035B395F7
MTIFRKLLVAGVVAVGVGLPALSPAKVAEPGSPGEWAVQPAEVCSALSVSKHYTLADVDFDWMRDQLNATLVQVPANAARSLPKSVGFRIPASATQFGLRLDFAGCESVPGPVSEALALATPRGPVKDCRDADCDDPAPGWSAPEGSMMVLWTCSNGVFREVEYRKVDGRWQATSVREERMASCPLPKDPEEGGGPRPSPDKG